MKFFILLALCAFLAVTDSELSPQMRDAIISGHEDVVKALIKNNPNILNETKNGRKPIHYAVDYSFIIGLNILKILLDENPESINAKDDEGKTPLHISMTKKYGDTSKILIDNCADVTAKDEKLETPLHFANDLESIKLFHHKPDVDARVKNKGTPCESFEERVAFAPFGDKPSPFDVPLLRAIYNDQEEIVKAMVANSSDILNEKIHGHLPIHFAAAYNKENMVKFLIEHNPEMVNATNDYGKTPLSLALEGNRDADKLVEYLISKGADVNPKGTTPLHWAAKFGLESIAKLLIENKADVNARYTRGWTPLLLATNIGSEGLVKLLIDNKADVNANVVDGYSHIYSTALTIAAEKGYENIAKLLIDNGADLNKKDLGNAPIHLAVQKGHINIVKLLVDNNVDVNQSDSLHQTALHLASEQGNKDIVAILMEHNANSKEKNLLNDTPCDIIFYNGGRKDDIYDAIFALMKCTSPVECHICKPHHYY